LFTTSTSARRSLLQDRSRLNSHPIRPLTLPQHRSSTTGRAVLVAWRAINLVTLELAAKLARHTGYTRTNSGRRVRVGVRLGDSITYLASEWVRQASWSRFCIFYIQQLITQTILKIWKQNKLHYHLHTLTVCLLEPHLLHLSGTLIGVLLSGQARKTGLMLSSSSFGSSSITGL